MTGHTPGPWEWDWGHSDNLYHAGYLAHERQRRVAYARGEDPPNNSSDYPEAIIETDNRVYGGPNDADACLIAAAPDMLAALKLIYQQYLLNIPDRDMLRAAIAKAEGPAMTMDDRA